MRAFGVIAKIGLTTLTLLDRPSLVRYEASSIPLDNTLLAATEQAVDSPV